MALDLLERIQWNITDQNLDDAMINGHRLTEGEFRLLQTPIHLTTPTLEISLGPIEYGGFQPVEFDTGAEVTPLQILGAIYTYYAEPSEKNPQKLRRDEMGRYLTVYGIYLLPNGIFYPDFHPGIPVTTLIPAPIPTPTPVPIPVPVPAKPAPTPKGEVSPQQRYGLTQQPYSEKSFVVRGNPQYKQEILTAMEKLGGKYNPYLKGGPAYAGASCGGAESSQRTWLDLP